MLPRLHELLYRLVRNREGLSTEEWLEVWRVLERVGESQALVRLEGLFWYRGRLPGEREAAASNRLAGLDIEEYLSTGRMRDPDTGTFIAKCPLYPDHSAPCHRSIGAHFGCIWPQLGMPTPHLLRMEGIDQPWSDPGARRKVFGNQDSRGIRLSI